MIVRGLALALIGCAVASALMLHLTWKDDALGYPVSVIVLLAALIICWDREY